MKLNSPYSKSLPLPSFQRSYSTGTVFTTLYFLPNFQMAPKARALHNTRLKGRHSDKTLIRSQVISAIRLNVKNTTKSFDRQNSTLFDRVCS
jgi:hypothetical protein